MIHFYSSTYQRFNQDRYNQLNNLLNIPENKRIKHLSKGMKVQLSIALSISIMPEVLVLDEPTSGLDTIKKREAINTILDDAASNGTTVFISSHNLSDLERICDSIAIIHQGEIKS